MYQAGDRVDQYTIKRLLGKGGQGEVYLAEDPDLDIEVAMKFLSGEFKDEINLERIRREARTLARMNNPNIVRIFRFNPTHPYLVLEYCGGGDLSWLIHSRKRNSLAETISIVRQICHALTEAHEIARPLLHRDLKPGNVLFDHRNVAKVTDFGLAKEMGDSTLGLTKTQGAVGTAWYMSPEQCRAEHVDHRTDLWSVGVILFEMLTWARPFGRAADTLISVAMRICNDPPDDTPYEIPEPVMEVIRRALQKDQDKRFASAREMDAALGKALQAVPGAHDLALPPEGFVTDECRLASDIAALVERGKIDEARGRLQELHGVEHDTSLSHFWRRRIDEESSSSDRTSSASASSGATVVKGGRVDDILSLVRSGEEAAALRLMGQLVASDPDGPDAQQLITLVPAEQKRVRASIERARSEASRARSSGDSHQALEIWKRLRDSLPDHPRVIEEFGEAEKAEAAGRQERARAETERQVRPFLDREELSSALALWDGFLETYPDDSSAAQLREAVWGRLEDQERAGRLASQQAEAREAEAGGDLERALTLWKAIRKESPGSSDAAAKAEALERTIEGRKRKARVEETRVVAARLVAAGDVDGAVGAWQTLLAGYPDDPEVRGQIEDLRRHETERRQAALRGTVQRLVGIARSRLEARRYASLAGPSRALEEALRAGGSGRTDEELAAAGKALREAIDSAELELAREQDELRSRLLVRLEEAASLGRTPSAPAQGTPTPAEVRLDQVLTAAGAALSNIALGDEPGDPLEALRLSEQELAGARSALEEERKEETQEARSRVERSLKAASKAVERLQAQAGDQAAALGIDLPSVRQRHAQFAESADSLRDPSGLQALGTEVSAFQAEVDAALGGAVQGAAASLRDLVQEGRLLAVAAPDESLAILLRQASGALAAHPLATDAMAGHRHGLSEQIRSAITAGRRRLEERLETAKRRWSRAVENWGGVARGSVRAEVAGDADSVQARGATALKASLPEELEACATRLEGLARGQRLAASWDEVKESIALLEGTPDSDGIPLESPTAPDAELLAEVRHAIAEADDTALRAAIPRLRERASELQDGSHGGSIAARAPTLPGDSRRLNERVNPRGLRRFDRLSSTLETAVADGEAAEARQLIEQTREAHRSLVPPAPLWRSLLPAGVALVIVLAAVAAWVGPWTSPGDGGLVSVRVFSPAGEARIQRVTRDGEPMPGLAMSVPAEGVTWELADGRYEVESSTGPAGFDVPADRVVLLPERQTSYDEDIWNALRSN